MQKIASVCRIIVCYVRGTMQTYFRYENESKNDNDSFSFYKN